MGKELSSSEKVRSTHVSSYLSAIGAATSGYLYKGSSGSYDNKKNNDNKVLSLDEKESELNTTPVTDLSSDAEMVSTTSSPTKIRSNRNSNDTNSTSTQERQEELNMDKNLTHNGTQERQEELNMYKNLTHSAPKPEPPAAPPPLTNRVGSQHSAFSGTAIHRPVPIVNRTAHSFTNAPLSHRQPPPPPSPHAGVSTADMKFQHPITNNRTASFPSSHSTPPALAGLHVNPEMAAAVYAQASPLARMRSNRSQPSEVGDQTQQPTSASGNGIDGNGDLGDSSKMTQNQNQPPNNALNQQKPEQPLQTEDEIVAAKHRKWKRNLRRAKQKQRMRLDGDDDQKAGRSSMRGLGGTAGCLVETDKIFGSFKGKNPLQSLEGFWMSRCGSIEDVFLGEMNEEEVSVYSNYSSGSDSDSEDSEGGVSVEDHSRNSRPEAEDNSQRQRQTQKQGLKSSTSEETPTYLPKGLSPARKGNTESKLKERQIARKLSPSSPGKAATQNTINLLEGKVSTSADDDDDELRPVSPQPVHNPARVKVGIKDRHFIRAFIEEISNEGVKMIWHREQLLKEYSPSPTCKLYLRLGRMGSGGIYEPPRLVWDIENPGGTKARGSRIDLFDIDSLEKPTILQIQNYPFAVPGSSVFVRSNNGKQFLFEAPTDEEARRVIHGVRWMIARLAFNLIIGNREVSCELLDFNDSAFSMNTAKETMQNRAMNDISNQLVDKSISPTV